MISGTAGGRLIGHEVPPTPVLGEGESRPGQGGHR